MPHLAYDRRRAYKTVAFLTTAVLANSFGNLLLAIAMDRLPQFSLATLPQYLERVLTDPLLLPGTALTLLYSLSQLSLFSWADLSYVVPFTACSYILTTLLSEFVLGEHVHAIRWLGVVLISIGVLVISRTPSHTQDEPEQTAQ